VSAMVYSIGVDLAADPAREWSCRVVFRREDDGRLTCVRRDFRRPGESAWRKEWPASPLASAATPDEVNAVPVTLGYTSGRP